MKIEVSNGEIIDKLTILQIKLEKISDPDKVRNIKKEHDILFPIVESIFPMEHPLVGKLKAINQDLWEIEDRIRELEKSSDFGQDFVQTARQVYLKNDERARIKQEINRKTNSDLTEEKSYQEY